MGFNPTIVELKSHMLTFRLTIFGGFNRTIVELKSYEGKPIIKKITQF